jgi:hypothetical protein
MSLIRLQSWGRLWWAMLLVIAVADHSQAAQAEAETTQPDRRQQQLESRAVELQRRALEFDLAALLGPVATLPERLDRQLSKQVTWMEREFGLTGPQKTKLLLAGRGDIKRVLDSFAALEKRIELARDDPGLLAECRRELSRIEKELEPGIFASKSLYGKTMARTITREQRTKAHTRRRQQDLARYFAHVADAATTLALALGMSDQQRGDLTKLLRQEIDPPLHIGDSDRAYIMIQFAQLPEAKIRPICNDAQWRVAVSIQNAWAPRWASQSRPLPESFFGD